MSNQTRTSLEDDNLRRRTEDLRKLCIQMDKRIKSLEKEVESLHRWGDVVQVGRC